MRHSFLFFDYLRWHYSDAFVSIWGIIKNFVWFFFHFFSITLLIRTLFKPWHNLQEKPKMFMSELLETFVLNILMRIFGLIARLITITMGLVFIIGTLLVGILFSIFWIVAPLVGVLSLLVGVRLLF